jgi:DNA-binding LytR/AlgR family response regulator
LIVEDEMIIAAKISMQLTGLGYEVTGILPRGEEAIKHVFENHVDILLLDIQLKGNMDGIETAVQIQKLSKVPIIYLTANADEATFDRAKMTKPAGFISKPFKQLDLQRAVELAYLRTIDAEAEPHDEGLIQEHPPVILSDRIFVRCRERMLKIMLSDILYIEADRNYSRIFTSQKEFLLSTTLKTIEEKLSNQLFVRVHRSYIVNMAHVDEVGDGQVFIEQKGIPLSAGMRENLLERLQTL